MRSPQPSIRDILLLIIGTLTLIIALLVATDMYGDWRRLANLKALQDASVLSDELFNATDKLAVERDIVLSMLHAKGADTATELRPRLLEARRSADDALHASMAALDRYRFPELADLRAKIGRHSVAILALRQEVDNAAKLRNRGRETELSARWSSEVTTLVVETQNLWIGFVGHFTNIDPIATQHLWYKHFLRTIIDYSGRERSLIGQLVAENVDPTPDQVSQLLRGQGIADQGWQMSKIFAEQSGIYGSIAPSYVDARSQYLTMHDMIRDLFYVPGTRHGITYPISVDLWFELSMQASDALGALHEASISQTQKYMKNLIAETERQMILQVATFIVALLLCVYSFRVIVVRVIRPINAMIDALLKTTRGEPVNLDLPQNREDEVGKLADVLNGIRRTLEQVRRTAAELDRSENHLRSIVDHTIDGLITIDSGGTIKSFNHACERLFSYSAGEVIGQNVKILMPEPYHTEHDGYLERYHATKDAHIIGTAGREVTARRKDGSIFPIELSISMFPSGDGRYFSGIIRDITKRKEAEQTLLRHTLALERSNKELDDFAYIASHDLKEPLRGIHNHSRFLLEDNAEKLGEESAGRLIRLVFLSQRMERLVNDLLYFSRLGRQQLAVQPTDLGEVIADIESTLEHFLEERNAQIVAPTHLPIITCDKPRVTEVLRNLITNAAKYNDKEEKLIEIGLLDSKINPGGTRVTQVLFVKDNGLGIAPEFHQDIFRIFKRLQASKDPEEGTGVGLTFVKKIIERHGGEIWLESEPGRGTTFYFTLEAIEHDRALESQAA